MFKALALLLAGYTIYAIVQGKIYAKAGAFGRTVSRGRLPGIFGSL
jgi:hypothetical protein